MNIFNYIIQYVVQWYKLYPDLETFLTHKISHVIGGIIASVLLFLLTKNITLALLGSFAIGIGKEVSDELQSPEPLYAHTLDVITTTLGGLLGVGLVILL